MERGGLYIVTQKCNAKEVVDSIIIDAVQSRITASNLWHQRLRHPSMKTMMNIESLRNEKLEISTNKDRCVCPIAKQSRLTFPSSSFRSEKLLELVHMDVWGPYKILLPYYC